MFGLTPIDLLGATAAITLGAVVQAATGLGGGLVVVPLLALIRLDLVPGFILGWLLAAPLASRLDRGHTRIAVVLAISAVSALVLIGRSI